jgi:serine/threonine protein kinase/formylglycine-generating enzyme required for sulfatase activity
LQIIKQYEQLWESAAGPPNVFAFLQQRPQDAEQWLEILLFDQQRRWMTHNPLQVEDYLAGLPPVLTAQVDWQLQLAIGELEARRHTHRPLSSEEISSRFPDLSDTLHDRLASRTTHGRATAPSGQEREDSQRVLADHNRICDHFEAAWRTTAETPRLEEYLAQGGDAHGETLLKELLRVEVWWRTERGELPMLADYAERFPQHLMLISELLSQLEGHSRGPQSTITYISSQGIGVQQHDRYRLDRVLGEGAFGRVYLGFDEDLYRQVAIKVPTKDRFQKAEDADAYLAEARIVASLDHPHIVPVYDLGRTLDGSIYVVSKFIEGCTLEDLIKVSPPPERETARILATIAAALQYAHDRRLIHRDVKPANILIERQSNTPYLTDFGLAIREEDYLKQCTIAGTPAYMSPEQIRGEGHRLDGRSDLFSLGVILYELLTGMRPFRGSTVQDMLHRVLTEEPRSPRSIQGNISAELERICLQSLAKRTSERYATAAAMAEDLQQWLKPSSLFVDNNELDATVVPKGLRSFDSHDADFFLELLPGQRNRDGLPESIAFWKQRIEQTDPERTFSVGLIYGPSGCGKSSLVKAGLLPHLSPSIVPVYVEATAEQTEIRLLHGLRKRLPKLTKSLGLTDTLASLRRSPECKVVLFIDQFEQWLHAHRAVPETELVRALRQCDGTNLQAIVMIRDDFAMAAARWMKALEVPIRQGENFATVDLFEVDHACQVLQKFGQAFGRLPRSSPPQSPEQSEFIRAACNGLAEDGKVVSVRLALFTEMIKDKPWTLQTLEQVGGAAGVGVNFLEETFGAMRANPLHRWHAAAARGVLSTLLPDTGTDIKGHMRSKEELLAAAGYEESPQELEELLRILDVDLRLITPTDPEGQVTQAERGGTKQYYQLTHDYLIGSLREWLSRKQRETKQGRAEIKLAERAAAWRSNQESKQLPTLSEWLAIRRLTTSRKWKASEAAMMTQATRYHLRRLTMAATAAVLLAVTGLMTSVEFSRRQELTRMEGLVGKLLSAAPQEIPEVVNELNTNPSMATKLLEPFLSPASPSLAQKKSQLHARLAMVARDPRLSEPLVEELLSAPNDYLIPIRQMLRPFSGKITAELTSRMRDETTDAQQRFRAALALADYIPATDENLWSKSDLKWVVQQLVSSNAEFQPLLRDALRPISTKLLDGLEKILNDPQRTEAQQLSAANALADYAASDIPKLAEWLTIATPEQFAVLFPLVSTASSPETIEQLAQVVATAPDDELGSVSRIAFGQRRANAAVAMLRLEAREKLLPVFEWSDDPEALTQFIFRCKPRGIKVEQLLDLLATTVSHDSRHNVARDDTEFARYALLLAIAEYAPSEIPATRRDALVKQLADWYAHDPNSGVHGAAGWLLRHLHEEEIVQQVDRTVVPYSPDREWFTLAITVTPNRSLAPEADGLAEVTDASERQAEEQATADPEPLPKKTFYYTFIVFKPGEYTIGSPADEPEQEKDELKHQVRLTRSFAILDREITFDELIAFSPQYAGYMQQFNGHQENAGFGAHWFDSLLFCRWLGENAMIPESDQAYASVDFLKAEDYLKNSNMIGLLAPQDCPVDLTRRGFRLPTEAEWEVACRAGARTSYAYGSDVNLLSRFGWFAQNSGKRVHSPRELLPNARGIYDLHGNLFEFAHDWWEEFGSETVVDPLGAKTGLRRVNRGGGWGNVAASCRSGYRNSCDPSVRAYGSGIRLAVSLPESTTVSFPIGEADTVSE